RFSRDWSSDVCSSDLIQQPALANTLRTIARGGADAFYRGEIAVNTIRDVAPYGALVTVEDYAAYAPELYENGLRTPYRGYDIVRSEERRVGKASSWCC